MFGGGPSFSPDTDIPDLSGKVVLVTGGMKNANSSDILSHLPTLQETMDSEPKVSSS